MQQATISFSEVLERALLEQQIEKNDNAIKRLRASVREIEATIGQLVELNGKLRTTLNRLE